MFTKILIANRGEIALRIIRTCKEMGIKTVAVYSDADLTSLHVKYADEAVNIGPPLSRKSYLNIERMIDAAKYTGADAIHPGYGFLAESASFAKTCEDSGIKFIGPPSKTHRVTGDKVEAIRTARNAGVFVSPGSDGVVSSPEEAVRVANRIGYPVIIKASGGGGGRGMRIACDSEELASFMTIAKGEAKVAFNNPDIYIEKYIEEPHHIEVQILGDEFGHYVHLGERECSIQKRYQKLIEESPSPFIDEQLRKRMGEAAIKVARSVGYVNAGTVEFLVDAYKNFYFNEMNSRLQVEHPVTEMVTGIDLVRQQLLIAAGEQIEFSQDEICHDGWAIECRINAEDPENNFMPCPGIVNQVTLPSGAGIRIDTHLYDNYEVPPFYDSLIAKLIVWGKDRNEAIERMKKALGEFHIEGIRTTIPLHKNILMDDNFVEGNVSTHFLEQFEEKRKGL